MAVNYETGVASDPTDLLAKLRTFSGAHGWSWTTVSGGWVGENGDIFFGIANTSTSWITRGCLSLNGGLAYDAQPNNSGQSHTMVLGAGPFIAYHFYVGDEGGRDYIHVVCEVTAGLFRHWSTGHLIKVGSYTGGVYTDSTDPPTSSLTMDDPESADRRVICDATVSTSDDHGHVWIDYDGKSNNWQVVSDAGVDNPDTCTGSMRGDGIYASLRSPGPLDYNQRTPLWPLKYFAGRPDDLRSVIGRIPNMRQLNIRNFEPGELLALGGDTWQVFPVFAKYLTQPANGILSSGLHGYAYLR